MRRVICAHLVALAVPLHVWAGSLGAAAPKARAPTAGPPPRAEREQKLAQANQKATECYKSCAELYMKGKWAELKTALKGSRTHFRYMTPKQRINMTYIRRSMVECRPPWWKKTRSASSVSFTARIWNRPFTANYMPTESLGFTAPVDIHRGRIRVVVSWRPNMIDSPRAANGTLAKKHGMSKGDVAEVVVWHELGHNYVTTFLPPMHVIRLYNDYNMLFHQLQEFYADMTALHHCSPKARLACLLIRLDCLSWYSETESHTRLPESKEDANPPRNTIQARAAKIVPSS